MPRAYFAERLLALFTTRERAAAIVGDLLELHCGPAGFWLAVIRTTWALSWRFALGFLLAAAAEFCTFFYVSPWFARLHGTDPLAELSGLLFTLFAAGTVFSLVRFGTSDAITRLGAALALLAGLDYCFWRMPLMRPATLAMMALVILLSCRTRLGRFALLRLLGSMVAAAAPLITLIYWFAKATAARCRNGCNLDLRTDPVIVVIPIAFLLSSGVLAGLLDHYKKGRSQVA